MAENLQIRLADPGEADRLAEIEAICFPPAEAASHEEVVKRMGAFQENFVVAVKDEQIVGFINGGTTDKPVLPDEFYHTRLLRHDRNLPHPASSVRGTHRMGSYAPCR